MKIKPLAQGFWHLKYREFGFGNPIIGDEVGAVVISLKDFERLTYPSERKRRSNEKISTRRNAVSRIGPRRQERDVLLDRA